MSETELTIIYYLPFITPVLDFLMTMKAAKRAGTEFGLIAEPLSTRIGLERAAGATVILRWVFAAAAIIWLAGPWQFWTLGILAGESATAAALNLKLWLRYR